MKVLVVSNCPVRAHLGSGYVIGGYAARMRSRGHDVTVLDPSSYEWLPWIRVAKRLRMFAGFSAAASWAVRRSHYDLVELWGAEAWWIARRFRRRQRRPIIVARSNGIEIHRTEILRRHGPEAAGRRNALRRLAATALVESWQDLAAAFRCVDLLTTVSEFDRRYAVDQRIQPPERVLALENPLPDDWLGLPLRPERGRTLGFFGSWLPSKGITLLREILAEVLRQNRTWNVRLVGVGHLSSECLGREFAERVDVVPFEHDKTRLRELYSDTAIVVHPAFYEGFGLVLAEALACGCALAASSTGFAADLLHDREAVVLQSRQPAEWIAALNRLMTEHDYRHALARAGRTRVQSLRWSDAVDQLENVYQRLLGQKQAA